MRARTAAELVASIERTYPAEYLDGLREVGPGYEQIEASAAVWARVSLAIERAWRGLYIGRADAGEATLVVLTLARPTAAAGAFTVRAGSIAQDTASGRGYVLLVDVRFTGSDLGPHDVLAMALAQGYEYAVPGAYTSAGGEAVAASITEWRRLVTEPPYADQTVTITHTTAGVGGAFPALELLGEERGMPRRAGEPVDAYRARLRALPDTVTPGALRRAIAAAFVQFGETAELIEEFDVTYQTAYDGPSVAVGDYDPTLFAYDADEVVGYDPLPYRGRWLDGDNGRGEVVVVVPNLGAQRDCGMAYDDTAVAPYNHLTPAPHNGVRAHSAYDVPLDALETIVQGGYDGFDLPKQAVYAGLYATLQAIKPAGVGVHIELEGQ